MNSETENGDQVYDSLLEKTENRKMDIGTWMYDSIWEMIVEYVELGEGVELNLNTADEITSYVTEYIRVKVEKFLKSTKYKTLDQRLHAAVAKEFNVSDKIFSKCKRGLYSEVEFLAINVANYVMCKYVKEQPRDPMYEEIERMEKENKEFSDRLSKIKNSIGIP